MKSPAMVDLRNVYKPEEMSSAGFHYASIGRPTSGGKSQIRLVQDAATARGPAE